MKIDVCPFCRETDNIGYVFTIHDKHYIVYVKCWTCQARGPERTAESESEGARLAIDRWNGTLAPPWFTEHPEVIWLKSVVADFKRLVDKYKL